MSWTLTDDASSQYIRAIGDIEGLYELIEMYSHDEDGEEYGVYTDIINLRSMLNYTPEKLNEILKTFGYENISDVERQYSDPQQIMAECVFENNGYQNDRIFSGSEDECLRFIHKYMGEERWDEYTEYLNLWAKGEITRDYTKPPLEYSEWIKRTDINH